ncbi:MAG: hypothetical protein JO180_04125 [Gemmatirosa sp.]|nr:hypothetical protein [Gemmatirosa sp.]
MSAPRSKTELLARARHEARLSLGRAAFVRDARVLPIGVPIALGVAAVVYARAARDAGRWHVRRAWRGPRRAPREPLAVAAAVLVGAVALTYVEARIEWEVRRRAWRDRGA